MDDETDEADGSTSSLSLAYVEGLYDDFMHDPGSVSADWRGYFEELNGKGGSVRPPLEAARDSRPPGARLGPSFKPVSIFGGNGAAASVRKDPALRRDTSRVTKVAALQDRVDQLIRAYRVRGHMIAQIDPLGRPRKHQPELDPEFYDLPEADMDRPFSSITIHGPEVLSLRRIIERLRNTYCRSIGVQFMHIDDLDVKNWLLERMEGTENRLELSHDQLLRILTKLTEAVMFEEFIQKKYIGAKRFSLEGGESLIPLLQLAIDKAAEQGVENIVLGMAHRGRLNVLANIIGKSPWELFREFEEDKHPDHHMRRGDVKYHLGYSATWESASGRQLNISLCFNPSHLEFVNPVVLGRVRALQDRNGDISRGNQMAILVHGDAAFAGEGIVQETLNLSQLEAYKTGGTIHVNVNNQIGFTTNPDEGRSSTYATDIAKMLQIPIFHVNGEDPEAVAQVVELAMGFRKQFKRDVVIDMYCYRRRGHNEGDEPSFTQPLMYREIGKRKSVREGYLEHLLKLGEITREQAEEIALRSRQKLEKELSLARDGNLFCQIGQGLMWQGFHGGLETYAAEVDTGFNKEQLARLLEAQTKLPDNFHPHPKIERWLKQRRAMALGEAPLDWAAAEALALASLAVEGVRVRLCGQDSERGTFSHRHAVLHDYEDGHTYTPLQHLSKDQQPVEIYNSPLSEAGVMGFEYGFSLECPQGLVLWEAQFGDFSNAAQVMIDQFVISAEDKWDYLSGLVLLLPHGYEGMGAEHSSARLERFLTLAADDNIQVVNLTTPAQYFHCLRRQALRKWRKPLIVLTPKSLLRHPLAVSSLDECAKGSFKRILPDESIERKVPISRILLCSGKIYYELLERREKLARNDIAILRIEQYYPLQDEVLAASLAPYPEGTPVLWVQEDPENMGAWRYLRVRFGEKMLGRFPLSGVYRPAAPSPATGSKSVHDLEQEHLLEQAFAGEGAANP
ncbi:2-oxoglutarate dehydrogenase E1 component [bacterium]|nr:2-oxoglutarate dehydrogenase E1 component [bacterium]